MVEENIEGRCLTSADCPEGFLCSRGECVPVTNLQEQYRSPAIVAAAASTRGSCGATTTIHCTDSVGSATIIGDAHVGYTITANPWTYDCVTHVAAGNMDNPPMTGKIVRLYDDKGKMVKGIYHEGKYYYDENKINKPILWRY